jgi:hypothetical protein
LVWVGIDLAMRGTSLGPLQGAAAAAALAGATAIDSLTGHIIPAEATARAIDAGAQNKAFQLQPTPVNIAAGDISFTDSTIKVIARRETAGGTGMVTHFAAAFLGPVFHTLDMKASATALIQHAGGLCCNIVPVAAIPSTAGPFLVGCANIYTLKYGGGTGTNGNYGAIQLPPCNQGVCAGMNPSGAATYRCLLANGYCCCLEVGMQLTPKPGAMSGPTLQGLQARWDADSDQRDGICYQDYTGNGQRVVIVPKTTPLPNGASGTVTLLGFATFFLRERPGNGGSSNVIGEFLYDTGFGTGNGDPNSTTYAIRLIK